MESITLNHGAGSPRTAIRIEVFIVCGVICDLYELCQRNRLEVSEFVVAPIICNFLSVNSL